MSVARRAVLDAMMAEALQESGRKRKKQPCQEL